MGLMYWQVSHFCLLGYVIEMWLSHHLSYDWFHDMMHIFIQVVNGAVMQQSFIVEFVVNNQMCDECHRVEAKDYWRSCVQVRQKVCSILISEVLKVNLLMLTVVGGPFGFV